MINKIVCNGLLALSALAFIQTSAVAETATKPFSDDSWEIAAKLDIQGKNGWTTCQVFADDLYNRMTVAGGEAHNIVYAWRNEDGIIGIHAMVVYLDSKGRYWGMDYRSEKPVWLSGKTSAEWVQSFRSHDFTEVLSVVNKPGLKGQFASYGRMVQSERALVAAAR